MISTLLKSLLADVSAIPSLVEAQACVFREDSVDPATAVFRNDSTRLRVMIAATGHSRSQDAGPSTAGDAAIEITVFENPKLREGESYSLTDAAEDIALALHWRSYEGFRHLRYIDMQRTDADENDFRMVVTFYAQAALDLSNPVSWQADETTILGTVVSRTITSTGAAVFESDRTGDAVFHGARDLHYEIDLTCNAAITSEDDLPAVGTLFSYNGKSYVTTFASISSASADSSMCRLQGRTQSTTNN